MFHARPQSSYFKKTRERRSQDCIDVWQNDVVARALTGLGVRRTWDSPLEFSEVYFILICFLGF